MKLAMVALTFLVLVARLDLAHTSPPIPREVASPERPPSCGAAVVLTDVVPNPLPDEPERLTIKNQGAATVALDDWTLVAGGRHRVLTRTQLAPGQARIMAGAALGTLRLRNRDGEVRLVDPCGTVRAQVAWDTTHRGLTVAAPARPP